MKTAEQILTVAECKSGTALGQIRIINKLYRKQDESHMWPIRGKFNVTERAIRRTRGSCDCPYSYALTLEQEISLIVNNERNW